jgi:lactate permease
MEIWSQVYDPFGNAILSTLICAIPVVVLLGGLGIFHIRAHYAAIAGLIAAVVIAMFILGMPGPIAARAGFFGALFAITTVCWIIFNLIFLYRMTVKAGLFSILQDSIGGITNDRRLQLVLIAFCFGAFFEGAAGGGTPVAVTGAILIGLGFNPLAASGLSLIANTAPVAYGGLGTPIIVLQSVTNLDFMQLSAQVGRQLPVFSVIVPFWVVLTFCGFRKTLEVWPAILAAGLAFAIPQFIISNYHGPWLVDMLSAMISMILLALFLQIWKPKNVMLDASGAGVTVSYEEAQKNREHHGHSRNMVVKAWMPWVILTVVLFLWGLPQIKAILNVKDVLYWEWAIPGLHKIVQRVPPAVGTPFTEAAIWKWGIISATGTGILIAAVISGLVMGFKPKEMLKTWGETFGIMKFSLLTIVAMLALGYTTRYAGMDGTLGLAFANTGWLYPFFGTMIGWIGTALTGTDAASNALFGSQQVITANKLGLDPTLMAAANSSGGVMGKMIDAQSIVVASVATGFIGKEGVILRFVFWHSISLAALVGVFVMLQAYVYPFTAMVVHP